MGIVTDLCDVGAVAWATAWAACHGQDVGQVSDPFVVIAVFTKENRSQLLFILLPSTPLRIDLPAERHS